LIIIIFVNSDFQPLSWDKIDYIDAGYSSDEPPPYWSGIANTSNNFGCSLATTAMVLTLIGVRLMLVSKWRALQGVGYYRPTYYNDHQAKLPSRMVDELEAAYICATPRTRPVIGEIATIISAHPRTIEWMRREEIMLEPSQMDPRYNPVVPIVQESKSTINLM
jgi:hypothetical protein